MSPDKRLQEIADEAYRAGREGRGKPRVYKAGSPAALAKAAHDAAQRPEIVRQGTPWTEDADS
jgi:hypothetical protein